MNCSSRIALDVMRNTNIMINQQTYRLTRKKFNGHQVIEIETEDGRSFSFGKKRAAAICANLETIKDFAKPTKKERGQRASNAFATLQFRKLKEALA